MSPPPPLNDEDFDRAVQELYCKLGQACVGHRAAVVLTAVGFTLAAAGRHSGVSIEDVVAELRNQWILLEHEG
jgi:hypothetical protein